MLELRPNQDVDVTVKECFSLNNEACIIFQKYDKDWGEFIDVSIQNIQHKDKIQVHVQQFIKPPLSVLSIRAGSRPKQPATGQSLAGYFRLALLLILARNLK